MSGLRWQLEYGDPRWSLFEFLRQIEMDVSWWRNHISTELTVDQEQKLCYLGQEIRTLRLSHQAVEAKKEYERLKSFLK